MLLHVGVENRPLSEGGLALGAHMRPHSGVGELKYYRGFLLVEHFQ